jgi:hypothetical protein
MGLGEGSDEETMIGEIELTAVLRTRGDAEFPSSWNWLSGT